MKPRKGKSFSVKVIMGRVGNPSSFKTRFFYEAFALNENLRCFL